MIKKPILFAIPFVLMTLPAQAGPSFSKLNDIKVGENPAKAQLHLVQNRNGRRGKFRDESRRRDFNQNRNRPRVRKRKKNRKFNNAGKAIVLGLGAIMLHQALRDNYNYREPRYVDRYYGATRRQCRRWRRNCFRHDIRRACRKLRRRCWRD